MRTFLSAGVISAPVLSFNGQVGVVQCRSRNMSCRPLSRAGDPLSAGCSKVWLASRRAASKIRLAAAPTFSGGGSSVSRHHSINTQINANLVFQYFNTRYWLQMMCWHCNSTFGRFCERPAYLNLRAVGQHFITSGKEVLFLPDFVCLSVCLSVC